MSRQQMPICVFAFEPNPAHIKVQRATEKAYRLMGWQYTFLNVGVGVENGNLTFFNNDNGRFSDWGFSVIRGPHTKLEGTQVSIPSIDVDAWIQTHIIPRSTPSWQQESRGRVSPRIVVKMDVEGMELPILTKMVNSGVACKIHKLFLELHGSEHMYPVYIEPDVNIKGPAAARKYFHRLNKKLAAANCSTFMLRDSEKFLMDGKPYPIPPRRG